MRYTISWIQCNEIVQNLCNLEYRDEWHWSKYLVLLKPRRPERSLDPLLRASPLWVGRQKEPILGYVPKNFEIKNFAHKGFEKMEISKLQ